MAADSAPVMEDAASTEQVLPVLLGRKPEADVEMGKVGAEDAKALTVKARQESASLTTNLKYCEKIVLGVGVLFALAAGVSTPAIAMFTADSIQTLTIAGTDKEHMLDSMAPTLVKIGVLAVLQFVFAFGWQTCLAWAAAKQAIRCAQGLPRGLVLLGCKLV